MFAFSSLTVPFFIQTGFPCVVSANLELSLDQPGPHWQASVPMC